VVEYPHSYYPFPKGNPPPGNANAQPSLENISSMRRRGKGPSYTRAVQELGGVEDKIGGKFSSHIRL